MTPKLSQNIKGAIENESCSTTWVDSKTAFEPYTDPKNSPFGPKKVKKLPKFKSKSKVELEEQMENENFSTQNIF